MVLKCLSPAVLVQAVKDQATGPDSVVECEDCSAEAYNVSTRETATSAATMEEAATTSDHVLQCGGHGVRLWCRSNSHQRKERGSQKE
jgi:hypothetical protein